MSLTPLGILLPESVLYSTWFAVLATFVAINTVMYVTLATLKALPAIRPRDWFRRRYVRARTRSIYPDAVEGPDAAGKPQPRRLAREG